MRSLSGLGRIRIRERTSPYYGSFTKPKPEMVATIENPTIIYKYDQQYPEQQTPFVLIDGKMLESHTSVSRFGGFLVLVEQPRQLYIRLADVVDEDTQGIIESIAVNSVGNFVKKSNEEVILKRNVNKVTVEITKKD